MVLYLLFSFLFCGGRLRGTSVFLFLSDCIALATFLVPYTYLRRQNYLFGRFGSFIQAFNGVLEHLLFHICQICASVP